MPTRYRFQRPGPQAGAAFRGFDVPDGAVVTVYPASAGNEIVHSATGTDYIVFNAGGDTIVYG